MYDKFLSLQWIFDRCIEASKLFYPLDVILGIFVGAGIYFLIKKSHSESGQLSSRGTFQLVAVVLTSIAFWFLSAILLFSISFQGIFLLVAIFIAGGIALLVLKLSEFSQRRDLKHQFLHTLSIGLTTIISILSGIGLVMLTGLILGFLICSAGGQVFPGVDAAPKLHGLMKIIHTKEGKWPTSEQELKQLSPETYRKILDNAKTQYIYDPKTESYTWFVRPSKYAVAVFDDKRDFAIYGLSEKMNHFKASLYPPNYPGPWDQLPK